MGWLSDYQARQKAEAAAAKAASNGQPAPAPSSTQGDWDPSGDHPPYLVAAVSEGLAELAGTAPGGRNEQLYIAAKALGQFEDVPRSWLREKLREACELNGLTGDDGPAAVTRTIKSGFADADDEVAKHGWRDPDGPAGVNVTEVPMGAFSGPSASASASMSAAPTATQSKTTSASASTAAAADAKAAIFAAEQDFWQRDSLDTVFDAALSRMSPPWGILANCAARALHQVPPQVVLPATIGGKASLNWFGAVASISGDGKTSSGEIAALLIRGVDEADIRSMGSGEGIVAQYRPPGKNPNDRTSLMFLCDEVDTMDAMRARQGSTTSSVLCNAFMGSSPGHSYVKTAGQRQLGKHEYRMTLIVGVQPAKAGGLLEDRYSGMLQRFQWVPGFDPRGVRARARPNQFINSLQLPDVGAWRYITELQIPPEAEDEILTAAELRNLGLSDALDGHLLLVRLKFAYALAVLDNRIEMNFEDWRLAGIAMEVSKATRLWVELEYAKVADELAMAKGRPLGLTRLGADEARADVVDERVRNCARWAWERLRRAGPRTNRELQRDCKGKDQRWYNAAMTWLKETGYVESIKCADGKVRWQASKP